MDLERLTARLTEIRDEINQCRRSVMANRLIPSEAYGACDARLEITQQSLLSLIEAIGRERERQECTESAWDHIDVGE